MERYSKSIKRNGRFFRYDYKDCYLQWVTADGELVDEIGFHKENWDDPELRNEYIDQWIAEEEEAVKYML